MRVRLDLLAEDGGRRLKIGSRFSDAVIQVETEVPGAYDAVTTTGISMQSSTSETERANVAQSGELTG